MTLLRKKKTCYQTIYLQLLRVVGKQVTVITAESEPSTRRCRKYTRKRRGGGGGKGEMIIEVLLGNGVLTFYPSRKIAFPVTRVRLDVRPGVSFVRPLCPFLRILSLSISGDRTMADATHCVIQSECERAKTLPPPALHLLPLPPLAPRIIITRPRPVLAVRFLRTHTRTGARTCVKT